MALHYVLHNFSELAANTVLGERQRVFVLLTPKIDSYEMAQMLEKKTVLALPGCQRMSVNTLLCDTLGLAQIFPCNSLSHEWMRVLQILWNLFQNISMQVTEKWFFTRNQYPKLKLMYGIVFGWSVGQDMRWCKTRLAIQNAWEREPENRKSPKIVRWGREQSLNCAKTPPAPMQHAVAPVRDRFWP